MQSIWLDYECIIISELVPYSYSWGRMDQYLLPFVSDVYMTLLFKVVCASLFCPLIIEAVKPEGFVGFAISAGTCVVMTLLAVWLLGLEEEERQWVLDKLKRK